MDTKLGLMHKAKCLGRITGRQIGPAPYFFFPPDLTDFCGHKMCCGTIPSTASQRSCSPITIPGIELTRLRTSGNPFLHVSCASGEETRSGLSDTSVSQVFHKSDRNRKGKRKKEKAKVQRKHENALGREKKTSLHTRRFA